MPEEAKKLDPHKSVLRPIDFLYHVPGIRDLKRRAYNVYCTGALGEAKAETLTISNVSAYYNFYFQTVPVTK